MIVFNDKINPAVAKAALAIEKTLIRSAFLFLLIHFSTTPQQRRQPNWWTGNSA